LSGFTLADIMHTELSLGTSWGSCYF